MNKTSDNSDASQASEVTRTSMASTKADFRELKANSSATLKELQEFLRQLRGKSPQEMLGLVATSQLFRATILSAILVTVAIFGLTAISYFTSEEPTPASETVAEPVGKIPTNSPAELSPKAPVTDPKVTTPDAPDPIDPIDPLGVNDQLPAPPNTNPLENKGDDFLKDLE